MFQFLSGYLSSFFVLTKFGTIVGLTMTTVKFVVSKDSTSFLMTISCLVGMFAPHTFVQKLTTAAAGVSDEIYNLNWYEADTSTRKIILIFLQTTQKPLAIELPFFGQFSHVALGIEYKRVYILYNWILTIMK
ncbi:odorant receptor 22c-like [Onthophagus taurus]|uniref:odorant receptor 22c-like n=1 Tax=Onthophagus taurus TaxID=166361 RepID=UPI0039BE8F59